MPIRMTDDPDYNGNQDDNSGKRERPNIGGGGNNPLIYFLPQLVGMLFKYPKIGIPLLLLGGGAFFYFKGCGGSSASSESNASAFATGASMKQDVYDQAQVFEPLADNKKNPLPESASLLQYAPKRMNQGQQGSCVAWASSYACRTILHVQQTGENANQAAFSPAYLYNQIKLEGCQGAYIKTAMDALTNNGNLPFSQFPYTDQSCNKTPSSTEIAAGQRFKIKGFNRLSKDGEDYKVNMLAIKQNLAAGNPVVIGMQVGGSFMQNMMGKDVWIPTESDYAMSGFGGHAMCVIGYDDFKNGGAFQIMNSWGEEWGNNGVAYVRYNDFDFFVVESYGVNSLGKVGAENPDKFKVALGLLDNKTKQNINLKLKEDNVFQTTAPIKVGDRFKVEFTNTVDCYTYVFGMEKDGSSYVLFPYTKKHSPYCGIAGTRLFPKDKSLEADNIGNKDFIAVVVTKAPIDYDALNAKIMAQKGKSYKDMVNTALANESIGGIAYRTEGSNIGFETAVNGKNAAAMIIEIDKR
jgi:C1A family cysteine protease